MTIPAVRRGRAVRMVALVALTAVVAAACSTADEPETAEESSPSIGESEDLSNGAGGLPATEFEMSDGSTATFADFLDGKPLVINYIASWCPPCRAEMPHFQTVYAEVKDEVNFLSMALQDTPDATLELVEETGVQYPWGQDPNGELYVQLDGFAMPTTIYVSADGRVVGKDNGSIDEGTLRDRLAELFAVEA